MHTDNLSSSQAYQENVVCPTMDAIAERQMFEGRTIDELFEAVERYQNTPEYRMAEDFKRLEEASFVTANNTAAILGELFFG